MTSSIKIEGVDEPENLLRIDDVHRTFISKSRGKKIHTYAVRGVSFVVHKGEAVGVVGESGCGKTTLARIVAGLENKTRGAISFKSKPLRFNRSIRQKISMVFQDPYASLNPRLSTASIIREPMHLLSTKDLEAKISEQSDEPDINKWEVLKRPWYKKLGLIFETKRKRLEKAYASILLEQVQLRSEWALRYPHEFSGGQRQRIGIARALATSPELLILDEPVSALDVSVQAGVIALLEKLKSENDLAMMFISHDLRVVKHLCDRVVVMYLGQVMEDAPSDLLFSHPCHPYTRALIGSIPAKPGEKTVFEKVEETDKDDEEVFVPFRVLEGEIPSPTNPPQGCPFRTRCEKAEEKCKTQPPLAKMTDGRLVACHFPY